MVKTSKLPQTKSPYSWQGVRDPIFCRPYDLGGTIVWRFFCRYCGEFHTHGVGEGGRVPHCTDRKSPYAISGYYYLKLDPTVKP